MGIVESVDCCQLPKIGKRFNGYQIDSFEGFHSRESDATSKFGVSINFSRTNTNKFLLQYHLVCCPLVVAASISFLMEPITFPGRIGIIQTYLVTIILTITSFFASGQVCKNICRYMSRLLPHHNNVRTTTVVVVVVHTPQFSQK